MRPQSAISAAVTTITRTITVAARVFAPGHVGELTRVVPFELVEAVLEETGAREKRLRLLPSRVGVYFVLAMCLFPRPGYLGVWAKLTAALGGLGLASPSAKALREVRRRIGIAPLKALFEILAGPLGQPHTPGIMFRGYRTVSFDGCKSIKVPDTARNRAWLGKQSSSNGETGYPALALMTLMETGTRALLGAVFGPGAGGETGQARELLSLLDKTMLLLMDRGFDGGEFLSLSSFLCVMVLLIDVCRAYSWLSVVRCRSRAARASAQEAMLTGSSVSPRDRARAQLAAALVSGPVSQLVSRSSRPAAWSMVRSSTSTHGAGGGPCSWPAPVISDHSLRDPAGVGYRERVERLGPALGRAAFDEPARCLAVLAPAGFPGPVAGALVLDVADR